MYYKGNIGSLLMFEDDRIDNDRESNLLYVQAEKISAIESIYAERDTMEIPHRLLGIIPYTRSEKLKTGRFTFNIMFGGAHIPVHESNLSDAIKVQEAILNSIQR